MNLEFLVPFIDKGLGVLAFAALIWLIAQIVSWFREDQKRVIEMLIEQTKVLGDIAKTQAQISISQTELAKCQHDTNVLLERVLEGVDIKNRRNHQ
jgi:hypothetical protein